MNENPRFDSVLNRRSHLLLYLYILVFPSVSTPILKGEIQIIKDLEISRMFDDNYQNVETSVVSTC